MSDLLESDSTKYMVVKTEEGGENKLVIYDLEPEEEDFKEFRRSYFESNNKLEFEGFVIESLDSVTFFVYKNKTQIFDGSWDKLERTFRSRWEGF